MYIAQDTIREPLYVVAVVSNPVRYKRRWELFRQFAKHVTDSGARLQIVECAFGDRDFAVTAGLGAGGWGLASESGVESHSFPAPSPQSLAPLQLRSSHEIWHKENLINLGVQRLPPDWKYVAWIDADVTLANPNWVDDTLHGLQHYAILQPWSQAIDLGPEGTPFATYHGFGASYLAKCGGDPEATGYWNRPAGTGYWHTGFAWAIRRDAWDALGGLIDWAIAGSADWYMGWSLLGEYGGRVYWRVADPQRRRRGFTPEYVGSILRWQERAAALRKNVGCLPGLLLHHWHGAKVKRAYKEREAILIDYQFDPSRDLRRDWQGLWQLHDDGSARIIGLRDALRAYFRARDEDGN